jgi:hypothetical protein
MVKIQIKSEKLTPFGGIFSNMEQFNSTLSSYISALTAAIRSTMTSLLSEVGRLRKSMALSLN